MATFGADGTGGTVRHGYQTAATLGAWSLKLAEALPRTYVLSAGVDVVDRHWLGEEPLDLTLHVGPDDWTWRGVEVTVAGGTLRCGLAGIPAVARRVRPVAQEQEEGT